MTPTRSLSWCSASTRQGDAAESSGARRDRFLRLDRPRVPLARPAGATVVSRGRSGAVVRIRRGCADGSPAGRAHAVRGASPALDGGRRRRLLHLGQPSLPAARTSGRWHPARLSLPRLPHGLASAVGGPPASAAGPCSSAAAIACVGAAVGFGLTAGGGDTERPDEAPAFVAPVPQADDPAEARPRACGLAARPRPLAWPRTVSPGRSFDRRASPRTGGRRPAAPTPPRSSVPRTSEATPSDTVADT